MTFPTRVPTKDEISRFSSGEVWKFLERIGALNVDSIQIVELGTRDDAAEVVLRDSVSGLTFLPHPKLSPSDYHTDDVRLNEDPGWCTVERMDHDTIRRIRDMRQFFSGKSVIDFGSGKGTFLKAVQGLALSIAGVETVPSLRKASVEAGIPCYESIAQLLAKGDLGREGVGGVDTVAMFHVLEHLHDPIFHLVDLGNILAPTGQLIVEVPHANALLSYFSPSYFQHSLWSQHLVLHTRGSLGQALSFAGFKSVHIVGLQRYPLSNLLHWLAADRGGGHLKPLSIMDDQNLLQALEASLNKADRTDTLLAVASNFDPNASPARIPR